MLNNTFSLLPCFSFTKRKKFKDKVQRIYLKYKIMAKSQDAKKSEKKEPLKTAKEKKAEKREKKAKKA